MSFAIERRHRLSYETFAREYLYPCKPVIVTGALDRWKALGRWTPELFRSEFSGMKVRIKDREYGQAGAGAAAPAEFTMPDFIDRVLASTEANPAPYFRNQDLFALFPSLRADVEPMPEYLRPNWLSDRYLHPRVGSILNRGAVIELYIGGAGGSFPVLHYDGAGTHAFLMQIYGRKRYIVFPPDQERFLYPSPEKINLSLLDDAEHPDPARFPLFAQATPTVFTLEPGELLFVPSHWWHTATMLTPSITISANVLNQSNWRELVAYVSHRQPNPLAAFASRLYLTAAGARRAWRDRAWRDRAWSAPVELAPVELAPVEPAPAAVGEGHAG